MESTMASRLLLVMIAILASGTCSSYPGPQIDSETSLLTASQPSRTNCKTNSDCALNNFCEGKGQRKRCVLCVDCEQFQRKPKKSYDGETCATHPTQCGECNIGYEESGGVCIPKTTWVPNIPFPPVAEKEDVDKNEKDNKKEENVEAGAPIWIVALLAGVFFFTVFFAGATKFFYQKSHPSPIEEEAGLTSYPNSAFNGSYEQPPSAPPLEYQPQPPHFSNGHSNEKPSYNRIKAQEIFVNAIPFNNGFGATDGNDYFGTGNDDPVSLPDSVDGAAASTPAEGIPAQDANAGPSASAAATEREIFNSGSHFNMGGTPNQSLVPRSNPQPLSFGRMLPEVNIGTQANPDEVMLSFYASLGVTLRYNPSTVTIPSNEASHPSSIRSIASAPTSPSPRLVDDMHAVDLPQIQGAFLRSNVSMDSGTGVSEHDRSVPSRSVSGGFSELDESYLYDDFSSPSTFPQQQAAQVPQQDDEYLNRLQEEEPMDFQ